MNVNKCPKVAVVIVTFNRLVLLKECISALRAQTYSNFDIIVVNNGSTDGTKDFLDSESDLIVIHQDNCGGAGGFYAGQKYMYDHPEYDAVLLMDDDGRPDAHQITEHVNESIKYGLDFANALVVSKDTGKVMGVGVDAIYTKDYFDPIGVIYGHTAPFNGTYIWRHVMDKVGFIKREMFIWGDDREYIRRVAKAGFRMGTITTAVHYHPSFKGDRKCVIPLPFINRTRVNIKPRGMDKYLYRNIGYIDAEYGEHIGLRYFFYYFFRFKFSDLKYFFNYYKMGRQNDYSQF